MAALEIVGVIITVVNASIDLSRGLIDYIESVKHAEKEIKDIQEQILDTSSMLCDISTVISMHLDSEHGMLTSCTVDRIVRNANQYAEVVRQIESILNLPSYLGRDKASISLRHKVTWPHTKLKLEKLLSLLQTIKSGLQFSFTVANVMKPAKRKEEYPGYQMASPDRDLKWGKRNAKIRGIQSRKGIHRFSGDSTRESSDSVDPEGAESAQRVHPGSHGNFNLSCDPYFHQCEPILNSESFQKPNPSNNFNNDHQSQLKTGWQRLKGFSKIISPQKNDMGLEALRAAKTGLNERVYVEIWILDFSTGAWTQCGEYEIQDYNLHASRARQVWKHYSEIPSRYRGALQELFYGKSMGVHGKRSVLSIRLIRRFIRGGILSRLTEGVALHVQLLRRDTCTGTIPPYSTKIQPIPCAGYYQSSFSPQQMSTTLPLGVYNGFEDPVESSLPLNLTGTTRHPYATIPAYTNTNIQSGNWDREKNESKIQHRRRDVRFIPKWFGKLGGKGRPRTRPSEDGVNAAPTSRNDDIDATFTRPEHSRRVNTDPLPRAFGSRMGPKVETRDAAKWRISTFRQPRGAEPEEPAGSPVNILQGIGKAADIPAMRPDFADMVSVSDSRQSGSFKSRRFDDADDEDERPYETLAKDL
ncbi:hypothetical protein PRK78_002158 [Emydomyces testavorans]|uniref:Fungal N-terminal domain-containing protein n=1 Tax=Emydomyces testavorans TaxID=2070801 RepID=A0AAF0IG71_9EURO|nr:hypothetical protein PRK78_002158 [Emydomyces testavorans]